MNDKAAFSRRNFLRKMSSTIGGAASLAVISPTIQASPVIEQPADQGESKPQQKGYQRSEHVDTYYRLADF